MSFSGSLRGLDGTFDSQVYAIALPQGSQLRVPIILTLRDAIISDDDGCLFDNSFGSKNPARFGYRKELGSCARVMG
jgi:hypothetical protein